MVGGGQKRGCFPDRGKRGLPAASVISGSGTLCASWQCLEVPRGPPPSLAVQFVGSGTSLSGMDVELVGSRYRMSLVKKRFATGNAGKKRLISMCVVGFYVSFYGALPSVTLITEVIYRTSLLLQKKLIVCLLRGQGSTWPAAPCESWEGFSELCTFLSGGRSER